MVAGESSGDLLGGDLIKSLKKHYPHASFVGIGGERMQTEGFNSWYPMEKLSIMGIFEVLKHLFELLKLRKNLINKLIALKPDVFIGIDAPDFNFKVEQSLKEQGITAIHYVGPSVWAWRENRLKKIKTQIDGMLVLFPFEEKYYHKYNIPVKFVGHPLANQISGEDYTQDAREKLNLDANAMVTGLMPGSRCSEVNQMIDLYVQTALNIKNKFPAMVFLIPCINKKIKLRVEQSLQEFANNDKSFKVFLKQAELIIEASNQVLVTSGTATLEVALHAKPLVLAIKVHPISYWLMKKLATTKWIGLPNILAQKELVSELIQQNATVSNLTDKMLEIITDNKKRNIQIIAFKNQHKMLKQNASRLAAEAIISWMK
jgi:lipid-A-disaccharide synthase